MKKNIPEKIAHIFLNLILAFFCAFTTFPFIMVIIVSLTNEDSIAKNGYRLIPEKISTTAYELIFSNAQIFNSYKVSIIITVIGTACSILFSAMLAYTMSVKKVKYRNAISLFIFFTMIFNAGLVPWYLVVTKVLHLQNTLLGLFLPIMISPYNVFLIRNYFSTLPPSLQEAAEIDGAKPLYIFIKIMMPLSTPIIATVALFYSLAYWNEWGLALWLVDKQELYPLQYMLFKIQSLLAFMSQSKGSTVGSRLAIPMEGMTFATIIVTIGPIILVYPFVQKYFIKGIMIGAVKG